MVTSVGQTTISTGSGSSASQIAALEKVLAKYEKQLKQDEAAATSAANTVATQLLTAQIAALQAQISQLSNTSSTSNGLAQSASTESSPVLTGNGQAQSATPSANVSPQQKASSGKSRHSSLGNSIDVSV